ncbi:MAG: M20/M25/M40 family metallo-hydrolase, partial [Clostridiaceae bacterium]|nr:M20/M25/M40 family metallo-hydrolase [Clostridiaceae bacterium]
MQQEKLSQQIIGWRRALHRIPEVGFDLVQTTAYVEAELAKLGIRAERVAGGAGLTADIEGNAPGKTAALRADMDALPIREETGLPFASENGNMHACGHDGHIAMLLGAAALLAGNRNFPGKVRLLFQPAEENLGGA